MNRALCSRLLGWMLVMAAIAIMVPQAAKAQWRANVGAETKDESVQADGFFPNELWIKTGDSIIWTFVPKNEVHTVTFLAPGEERPSATPPVGPPNSGPGAALPPPAGPALPTSCGPYATAAVLTTLTTCVSSNPSSSSPAPTTFEVTFPVAGNYKLVCLVHTDMNGTVHVVDDASFIHSQRFYDDQGRDEAEALLSDNDRQGDDDRGWKSRRDGDNDNAVIAGIGEIAATGGGLQYRAVVRFLAGTIRIRAGESVEWTNLDPTEPHTVTFGTEPAHFVPTTPAGLDGTPAADGTLTATFNSAVFLNSGFIKAQAPDRTWPATPGLGGPPDDAGAKQLPPGTTRIRITFPTPGTFYYHCALHDVDGMLGEVIVEK